jgi:hypothetical protein
VLPTLDGSASRHTRREGEDASPRRLQPTYDTCTRWMTRCPTGGSRRLTECRRSRDDLRRRPVSEPAFRVETCLTARRQLRPPRSGLLYREDPPPAALSTAWGVAERPLAPLLALLAHAQTCCALRRDLGPLPPPSRQRGRPTSDRSAFHRQVLVARSHELEPATATATLPPRSGFRRPFTPRGSRVGELDRASPTYPPATRGPDAACRLLPSCRSTSTTAIFRTPSTTPVVAHRRSSERVTPPR